jgi:predicted nucleic acid-binding protein
VILLDTSGLLAAIDGAQRDHAACAEAVVRARAPLLLSPFVLAELDYLLGTRVGAAAQRAFLEEVARGAYRLEPFGADDVAEAARIVARYQGLHVGIADASIVVLAGRHGARDVLTLDRRHFRVLRRPNGRPFRLLPDDAR